LISKGVDVSKVIDDIKKEFNKISILKKLDWMIGSGKSGYEKWLQHELAYSLAQKDYDVKLEMDVETNKVKSAKARFHVDIGVRAKGCSNNYFHAIEIKIANKQSDALRSAIRDLIKIGKMKSAGWAFRSVTAMVVVSSSSEGKYSDFWSNLNENKSRQWIFESAKLGKTGGQIYFLSWVQPPRAAEKDSFDRFLNFIKNCAKSNGLEAIQNGIKRSTPNKIKTKKIQKAKFLVENHLKPIEYGFKNNGNN